MRGSCISTGRSVAGCALALAIACGGSGSGIGGDGQDYSANFAGQWNGTAVVAGTGQSSTTPGVAIHITSTGKNALAIGDICVDLSGPPATPTGATTFTIGARSCPPAPVTGCSSVTLAVARGSGVLAGSTLSFGMDGTASGCSQTIPFSLTFSGTRTVGSVTPPPGSGPPPPAALVVSLRQTQFGTPAVGAALDASGTTGSGSAPLTFAWTLVSAPAGSVAAIADAAAPIAHLTPDLAGDYVAHVQVSQGTLSAGASVTLSVFAPIAPIAFRPVAAQYSRALDRLVAISTVPDRIHVFDPVSQQDTAIALPLAPRCLSVSSDGLFAAVGHDAWVSYVDLSAAKVIATWAVTADAGDVVIGDPITIADPTTLAERTTRFAYVFPSRDQWVAIHDVDLGNGAEKTSGGLVYAGMRAKLLPGSKQMFAIDTGLSPQQLYRFDIGADGITGSGNGSPYWGSYGMGLAIWISRDGQQILSAAGNRFRPSDMTYAGKLGVTAPISSADWSGEAGRWVVQPSGGFYASDPSVDTSFWTVDSQFLAAPEETKYPRFVRAPEGYLLHGRHVFYDRTGTRRVALLEIDDAANLLDNYAVLVF